MIAGAMLGGSVAELIAPAHTQGLSVLTGFGGLAVALVWLVGFSRKKASCERYRPRVLRLATRVDGSEPLEVHLALPPRR
jgi:positive regulator of sigma E activity